MIDFDIECCPHCGAVINYEANTCIECGGQMTEGGSFCPYLQKKAEVEAEVKSRREKFKAEDKLRSERIAMKEAQETFLINEVIEIYQV